MAGDFLTWKFGTVFMQSSDGRTDCIWPALLLLSRRRGDGIILLCFGAASGPPPPSPELTLAFFAARPPSYRFPHAELRNSSGENEDSGLPSLTISMQNQHTHYPTD